MSTMPSMPEIAREHIVACAEYAEHWMSQAQMWRECRRPDLADESMKQARAPSYSAFRWAHAVREAA